MNTRADDVVLVSGARTPVGLFGGSLKEFLAIDLAAMVIRAAVERAGLGERMGDVGDVVFGEMYTRNREEPNVGRLAAWKAGLPKEVPGMTLQRACASGVQAIISASQSIVAGQCDVAVAGGTESMSNAPYELYGLRWGKRWTNEELFDAMYSPILSCPPTGTGMGITAENLARQFDIGRAAMDEYAVQSHQKAAAAWERGVFNADIVPVSIPDKRGGQPTVFAQDESVRKDASVERMAKLKPVFEKDGKVTAGNSCPLNDGAGAVVLTTMARADAMSAQPIVRIAGYAITGVDPDIMGYGPVVATRKLLDRQQLKISDIDLFQIHEPFAAVPLTYIKEIGPALDCFNPNGGPIALGHPISATGVVLTLMLAREMQARGARRGLVGMCQGTGMGTVLLLESVS